MIRTHRLYLLLLLLGGEEEGGCRRRRLDEQLGDGLRRRGSGLHWCGSGLLRGDRHLLWLRLLRLDAGRGRGGADTHTCANERKQTDLAWS